MQTPIRLLAAAVLLMFLVGPSAAQDLSSPIERTFAVSAGGELSIDLDRGSISIDTSERNEVEVRIEREGSDAFLEQMKFTVEETSDGVAVRGDYEDGRRGWRLGGRNRVHVHVTIPTRYDVVVETSGGSIEVADLEGSVHSTTSGGSLRFARIDGSIYGRTSGGSVAIDRAGGEVDVKTSGGGITVNEVNGTIRAETSGGSIRAVIADQPKGDCVLTTSGGGIRVSLAPDVKLDVEASSSGGRVSTDIPITVLGAMSRNRVTGTLNGGGPLLKLHTSGGGVRIESN